jgi:hypothetical protein
MRKRNKASNHDQKGLATLVLAQNDPDNQSPQVAQTFDTVTMQLVGNSGQIKLFPSSDSNRFIRIRMSQLVEVDASSSPVPGPNNNVNFASLAQRNSCGSGAGWSSLQKQTSSSGATFYQTTFTCTTVPQGPSGSSFTFKLRVSHLTLTN